MNLQGMKIAVLATNGFEDSELVNPVAAAQNAGADVAIISLESGSIIGSKDTEIDVNEVVSDVHYKDFDGLILPGGVANPDRLRMDDRAVWFVKGFFDSDKPVAAICHAPWMIIEAGAAEGKQLTSWPSLKTDLENAGAEWVDEEVVKDGNLITSRNPDDLPAFTSAMVKLFIDSKN